MFAKYIVFDCQGSKRGIIFDQNFQHSDIANSINGKPISGGMCCITSPEINTVDVKAWGFSTSLKLDSNAEDYKNPLKTPRPGFVV